MSRRRFRRAERPIDPGCPSWCDRDHAVDLADDDGLLLHSREFGEGVEVIACDDLQEGRRSGPDVTVRATSCETTAQARRLALAVLDAADYLEGGGR